MLCCGRASTRASELTPAPFWRKEIVQLFVKTERCGDHRKSIALFGGGRLTSGTKMEAGKTALAASDIETEIIVDICL